MYADMLYVYGCSDASVTVAVENYCRRFPMPRILDRREFSKVFNTLPECATLSISHVSSEGARQQHVEEQQIILQMVERRPTKGSENFLHVSVFHEHVYGEHCMMTDCTHFTHSVCKIYTQGTVPCV